ncbi:hypothetical protein [Brevundimonas aurifodinae]|uniref:Uncharacterized protein n=2 Tax=Brevundimonas TaxID=41275 RepID=A0ABV1NNG3_9CAUL|nr:MAG: hypothetical protein B7Z42_11695 [Brevundimonas sp. 12-68-7]OYX29734.1 MAG: hypothetical protein B7Z01_15360 [Brevundimonas subvibrioides]
MPRVRPSLALIAALGLSIAACGGSEPAPEAAEVPATEAAYPVAAPPAMMPDDAPPQEEAPPEAEAAEATPAATCREAVGEAASARLVARCIAVSPATRPPCNALNPCEMIQGEIDRSCGQYGPGEEKPAECVA